MNQEIYRQNFTECRGLTDSRQQQLNIDLKIIQSDGNSILLIVLQMPTFAAVH